MSIISGIIPWRRRDCLLPPVLTGLWPQCCNISTLDPADPSVHRTHYDSAAHDRGGPRTQFHSISFDSTSLQVPDLFQVHCNVSPCRKATSSLVCHTTTSSTGMLGGRTMQQFSAWSSIRTTRAHADRPSRSDVLRLHGTSSHRHSAETAAWRNGEGGIERAHGVVVEPRLVYVCHAGAWVEKSWKLQIPNARCRSGQYCYYNTTCLL
jgi:hypothetical protein